LGGKVMGLDIVRILVFSIIVALLTSFGMFMIQGETIGRTNKTNENILINPNKDELVRILEQKISFEKNGKEIRDTAFLKYNDNQHFSMYVLPSYRLTTETTQLARLYYDYDKSIFMDIELLTDNINWQDLKRNTNKQLTTIAKQSPTIRELKGDFLEESAIHEVKMADGRVFSTYFLNLSNLKVKLEMETRMDTDHRDAFFQMAKTIIREE
jgi:hypothetical protein